MPITVPTPEREVGENQLPGVRDESMASAETFGGGQGLQQVDADVQRISKSAAEIATFEKIKADQIAVTDATGQLSEATLDILHNQKDGILNLQGKNAMGAPTIATDKYQKVSSTIASNLHTEDQRGMFARVQQNMAKEMDRTVQAHVGTQIRKYDDESTTSLIKNTQDAAALSYGDPEIIGTNIQRQKVALSQYADRHGMPDEWLKEKTTETVSATHEGVLKRMLGDGHDQMAVKYLEANKDDIDAKVLDQLRPIMKEGTLRGEGQRNADKFWDDADGDFGKAMDKARSLDNPDERQRTEQELRSRQEDQDRQRRAGQESAFQDGWKKVVQSGAQDPAAVNAMITPAEKIQMGPEHFKALIKANQDDPTDPDAWAKWQNIARDPDTLGKLSPSQVQVALQDFSKQDRAKEVSRWEAASRGVDKTVLPAKDFARAAAQVIPGYKPSKLTGDAAVAAKSLHEDIVSEMLEWQKSTGKPANPDERQKIIDKTIADRTFNQPTWFGYGPVKPKLVTIKDIPENDLLRISSLRTVKGLPLTNEQTERFYIAGKTGNKALARSILNE